MRRPNQSIQKALAKPLGDPRKRKRAIRASLVSAGVKSTKEVFPDWSAFYTEDEMAAIAAAPKPESKGKMRSSLNAPPQSLT